MDKQLQKYLQKLQKDKVEIEVDFTKAGLIGNCVTGKINKIMGDYVELTDCCPGSKIQIINIKEVNKIEVNTDS